MHPPAILRLVNLTRQFSRVDIPAVCSVNLTLYQGELLGLLGPSGCGKTTLLRLIAGFERPQTGTVELDHQFVSDSSVWLPPEKRGIGMVFQDYALFPHLTVAQNVVFGLKSLRGQTKEKMRDRLQHAIALVGLEGFENRYPHQLSGGQQQRVALARALAPHPALVLLDEPLSNLDAKVRLQLRQELRDILKAAGTSAIFVTHDQEEALSICDRVAVMCYGCLEQVGSPEDIYRNPSSRFVAEFVTQANFIEAYRESNRWKTELGYLDIHHAPLESDATELMIRQEDMQLVLDETSDVVIYDRQFLGREHRYRLRTPTGRILVARSSFDEALPMGSRVRVSISEGAIRVFPLSPNQNRLQPSVLS
ncbi:MAG: ABC transporter ATP-binding protein [Elainellaceae cyanobacterium]